MTTSLPPYPEYKASGVPWLGDVPAHWRLLRGKWLFRAAKVINTERKHSNVLSLTLRGVVNNDIDNPEGLVPKDYATYQYFAAGDLVFKLIDLENLRTSRVGLVHQDGIMSPAYIRLTPIHDGVQRYFFHQYYDLYQRGIYNQLGAGVRSTLTAEDLLDVPILLPPPAEQQAIVRYLDHIDRRVRRYIRAKQRLLALLREQKQAIIHQAVTRGLDASAPLKPSGVAWLGEVPAHWEVKPAKRLFVEVDERSEKGDEELLSVSHLTGVTLRSQKNITMFMAVSYTGHKLCYPGDLVLNTMWAWMGALGVSRQKGIVSPSYAVYKPVAGNNLASDFADYLLRTRPYISEFVCRSTGIRSSRLRLYPEQFLRIPIVCPPVAEQIAITQYIQSRTAEIDLAINRTQQQIALIQEYRTRLIADVVTGKVDVRAAEVGEEVAWAVGEGEEEGEEVSEEELQRMQTGNG